MFICQNISLSEGENLNDSIKSDSTTSGENTSVIKKEYSTGGIQQTHFELREFESPVGCHLLVIQNNDTNERWHTHASSPTTPECHPDIKLVLAKASQ